MRMDQPLCRLQMETVPPGHSQPKCNSPGSIRFGSETSQSHLSASSRLPSCRHHPSSYYSPDLPFAAKPDEHAGRAISRLQRPAAAVRIAICGRAELCSAVAKAAEGAPGMSWSEHRLLLWWCGRPKAPMVALPMVLHAQACCQSPATHHNCGMAIVEVGLGTLARSGKAKRGTATGDLLAGLRALIHDRSKSRLNAVESTTSDALRQVQ
mmetsp:Transcript_20739/g.47638  ORF Transcript_20739/g.47638 Transcript_20739/m.47638 type:complete len:210 (+) Transcript_20739:1820-2449(+)